jgi:hypothetical protein
MREVENFLLLVGHAAASRRSRRHATPIFDFNPLIAGFFFVIFVRFLAYADSTPVLSVY